MRYYINEKVSGDDLVQMANIAAGKARKDVTDILQKEHYKEITIPLNIKERTEANSLKKLRFHYTVYRKWKRALDILQKGDILVIQYPLVDHTIFIGKIGKQLKAKGVITILIIHDLAMLRDVMASKNKSMQLRFKYEESLMLNEASFIISHNYRMTEKLKNNGIPAEKLISLEIFDYLMPDNEDRQFPERSPELPVVIAGNLSKEKAGYVYKLSRNQKYAIYGINYSGSENETTQYMGVFAPEDLPFEMRGSFGLVWDGSETDTCAGIYGEYLRYNNPHKTSMYLASALPVIIWKEAALADFIEKNRLGITVESIDSIEETVAAISDEDYREMKNNALSISAQLRQGHFTIAALEKALGKI